MDRTCVITLIEPHTEYDESGMARVVQENRREVLAQFRSITRTEWADAGRHSIKPDISFVMQDLDYHGEVLLEWDGIRYGVYRTFFARGDKVELYCEKKGGVNSHGLQTC